MKPLLIFLFCAVPFIATAQPLTHEEATAIAHSLGERRILSDAGTKYLIKKLSDESATYDPFAEDNYPLRSKEGILRFCHAAFFHEYLYRIGAMLPNRDQKRDQRRLARKARKFRDDPEAYQQLVNSLSEKQYHLPKRFRGYLIEARIRAEDSLPRMWRVLPLFGPGQELRKGLIHATRSTIGKTRTRTAKDLLELELIDQRIWRELNDHLADSSITTEDEVLRFAAERAKYYVDYPVNRNNQLAFLDSLMKHGLLASAQKDALVRSLEDDKLRTQFEILVNCKSVILPEPVGKDSLSEYYSRVLDKVEQIVTGFHYTDLCVVRDTMVTPSGDREDIILSFQANNQTYGHRFEYYASADDDTASFGFTQLNRYDFYPAINSWLADQASPFRLYQATTGTWPDQPEEGDRKERDVRAALILLTEEQRKLWGDGPYFLSDEKHNNEFTTGSVNAAIDDFEKIGLFSHLSEREIDSCRNEVLFSNPQSWTAVLTKFRDVVHIFDWETPDLEHPYVQQVNAFSRIARGHFSVSDPTDDFDIRGKRNDKVHLSFHLNGKRYAQELSMNVDWLDWEFLQLIDYALRDNGVPGTFVSCYSNGQVSGYIFLSNDQQVYLRSRYPGILTTE